MALSEIGDINFPRDTTLKEMLAAQNLTNSYLAALAAENMAALTADYATIRTLVQQKVAESILPIGTQIDVNWTDASGNAYVWPFDVVHYEDVELEDGDTVPGMFLQAHYCSTTSVQFDQSEALYYCEEALPAGTYYFTIGTNWGTYCVSGTSYHFTTTVDIPAGGQIRIGVATENNAWSPSSQSPSNWRVWTYESASSTSCLEGEALELTEGAEGTELGATTSTIKYDESNINNLQRAGQGYNRWSQSAIRQYLNSSAAAGAWWEPQNNFDRPPAQLASYPGFMAGFDEDFLSILGKVKVTTLLNTVSDSAIGTSEDTYDTFFLASLEQEYVTPQLAGYEGNYFEYWKRASGSTTTVKTGVTGALPITYALNAQTSAQSVRLRSPFRSSAYYAWSVTTSGSVNYYYTASTAYRVSPVCVVC